MRQCPLCGENLLNDYVGDVLLRQDCNRKLNHKFIVTFIQRHNKDDVMAFLTVEYLYVKFKFDFEHQKLKIEYEKVWNQIPWVEPDMDNLSQFLKRLKKLLHYC